MNKILIFFICLIPIIFTISTDYISAQWVQMSNGMGNNQFIWSIDDYDSNIFAGAAFNLGIYLSTNNGVNWVQKGLNNITIYSVAISGTYIYAGTDANGVYLSTNNGVNWVQKGLSSHSIRAFAFSNNNIFAGTDDNGIYLSSDFGNSWVQRGLDNKWIMALLINGNNIFAGTMGYGIYHTSNNGNNWTQIGLNNFSIRAFTKNGNNIFAGTVDYGIYLSTNNGVNWVQKGLSNRSVYSLASIDSLIVAGTLDYGTYLTTNNGNNWVQKNQGFTTVPTAISLLIANNYIFAGTTMQSIWRRSLSEIITVIQNYLSETPAKYSLNQNYPNPFNPSTNIRYDLLNNGFVKLIVFDLLGRELEILVNDNQTAGTYEVFFDASKYPSGVYYYKLMTNNFTETKSMILLK